MKKYISPRTRTVELDNTDMLAQSQINVNSGGEEITTSEDIRARDYSSSNVWDKEW